MVVSECVPVVPAFPPSHKAAGDNRLRACWRTTRIPGACPHAATAPVALVVTSCHCARRITRSSRTQRDLIHTNSEAVIPASNGSRQSMDGNAV
ncbi:MAG: hypothetical protein ACPIOQ_19730, partial [Promethearchaeia archaeon]